MAFRFKGQVSHLHPLGEQQLPASVLSGLRKSGRYVHYAKNTGNVLVIFKEAGAHAFLKEPLHELQNESISIDHFSGYEHVCFLEQQLAEAGNNFQRIQLLEQFLLERIGQTSPDQLVLAAMHQLRLSKGMLRIKTLADTLCISQDAFEKRFRRTVGVSPKQFATLIRMKGVVHANLQERTLTELAYEAGYFDQAHFNKDFKLFTGQSPTDFFKSPLFW